MKRNSFNSSVIIVVLAGISLCAAYSSGDIWYVDQDNIPGGDGTSWAEAFTDIETAIEHAYADPNGDECMDSDNSIWVKSGTYMLDDQIDVDKVVSIFGGFPNEIPDPNMGFPIIGNPNMDDRDWKKYETIVNGNEIVRCFSINRMCEIDGFTIKNGVGKNGGGIFNNAEPVDCTDNLLGYISPVIRNCTFTFNEASAAGGAIYTEDSDPVIQNCTFSDNTAPLGGAVYQYYASPQILECVFENNSSIDSDSDGGGAIAGIWTNEVTGEDTAITNCLFLGNSSASGGGAISYEVVRVTITNCTFSQNTAVLNGGAYKTLNFDATRMLNCILWDNSPDELDLAMAMTVQDIRFNDIKGGIGIGSQNIDVDPAFVGASDFRLAKGSLCIDAGENVIGIDHDLAGTARLIDGDIDGTETFDMGCYEFDPPKTSLNISVTLQGTQRPDTGWVIPLTVRFFTPGSDVFDGTPLFEYELTTEKSDDTAIAEITDLPLRTYDVTATSEHTLVNVETNVLISDQVTSVDMGTLLEGDAVDDNFIDFGDLAVLVDSWLLAKGSGSFDPMADFDRNDIVDMSDFILLASNWMPEESEEPVDR